MPDPTRDQGFWGWLRRVARPAAITLIWLLTVAVLAATGAQSSRENQPEAEELDGVCDNGPPTPGEQRASLSLRGTAVPPVAFGRNLGVQRRWLEFDVEDPDGVLAGVDCLLVQEGPFIRDSGSSELRDSYIVTRAEVTGTRVRVEVTFDRHDSALGSAGSYVGTVSVIDPLVERSDTPIAVTMAYPIWQYPAALLVVLLLPGIFYVHLLKGSFSSGAATGAEGPNDRPSMSGFSAYLIGRTGMLAFIAGSLAAFGVYSTTYLGSATWGWEGQQIASLATAIFGAFVTGATAVTAAGADKQGMNTV